MKTKILLTAIITSTLSTAYAANNGAYLGFNINYMDGTFDHQIYQRTPPGPSSTISDSAYKVGVGFDAGYRWFFNRYNLGLGAFYFPDQLSHTHYGTTTTNVNRLNYDYGIKLTPGYLVLPNLNLQGILGYSNGHFIYKAYGNRNNYENTYNEPGYLLGGGVDYQIYKHLHTDLSYQYTYYRNKDNISGDNSYYVRNGNEYTKRVVWGVSYQF